MKNHQKGFIVPLLIIIVSALAIGGGAYVYTKNKTVVVDTGIQATSTVPSKTVSTDTSTKKANTSKSPSMAVSLKMYTNTKYGFQIQYPSDWSLKDENNGNIYARFSDSLTTSNYLDLSTNSISIISIPAEDLAQLKNGTLKQTGVWSPTAEKTYLKINFLLDKNIRVTMVAKDSNSQNKEDQMFSSIKFVAQANQVPNSSWKTYKNDTYGFQFQYPDAWKSPTVSNSGGRVNIQFSEGLLVVAGSYYSPQSGKNLSINEVINLIQTGAGTGSSKSETVAVNGEAYSKISYATVNPATGMYNEELSVSAFIPLTSNTNFLSIENQRGTVGASIYQMILESVTVTN